MQKGNEIYWSSLVIFLQRYRGSWYVVGMLKIIGHHKIKLAYLISSAECSRVDEPPFIFYLDYFILFIITSFKQYLTLF